MSDRRRLRSNDVGGAPRSDGRLAAQGLHRQPGAAINPGAIHRSVLAGFPAQIGRKGETREYDGPRGMRFLLSPGSSLFRLDPPWIVAAELVETTRLYARTAGRIRADWVERVAPHLVVRDIFEPHWLPDSGQVAAWERLTLHGLTLVPKRRVPFGPIDPRAARDIFIQNALVDETIRTDGAFLAHNRELIEQLEMAEAKKRARDVLVDLRARFDFYDARVPSQVHSTPSFEKWRREMERGTPRLLYMTAADLLRPGAAAPEPTDYPDSLELDGMRLPLDYRHEPGDPDDGVTLTVPLAALGQLNPIRLEWLVPGMLREKVVGLIRTLPKRQRVRFVPAAEYAEGAAESLSFADGSLPERLAEYLHRLTGTPIGGGDWRPEELPSHLRMNVRVIDARGETIARGRDVRALQRELAARAVESLGATARRAPAPRDGASRVAGGDSAPPSSRVVAPAPDAAVGAAPPELPARLVELPAVEIPLRVAMRQGGMLVGVFAALEDRGDSAALRLVASEPEARRIHASGVRRLLALSLVGEIVPLLDYVPSGATTLGAGALPGGPGGALRGAAASPAAGAGAPAPQGQSGLASKGAARSADPRFGPEGSIGLDRLALLHAPYGARSELLGQLVDRIAERAALLGGMPADGDFSTLRTPAQFAAAVATARPRLWDAACQTTELVTSILLRRHELDRTLDAPQPSTWVEVVDDVRKQVAALLPRGFIASTPWERLVHLPRYLAAALVRLQKLRDGGHRRDAAAAAELRPLLEKLAAQRALAAAAGEPQERVELVRFRWLLEELRVGLFAQELRTAVPVSVARLEREWARIVAG